MSSRVRTFIVTGCTVLALLGPAAHVGDAQAVPGVIGSYYPTQLAAGQTTVVNLATSRIPIQSIEITPSAGMMVVDMKQRDLNQGAIWWAVSIAVAKDAAPGPRMLVAVQPTGRTAPITLTIPSYVPSISDLRILSAQLNQPTVDVQFVASSQGGTFGDTPYVWFTLGCGPGRPEVGVVRGRFAGGTIRASIPNPRVVAGRAGAPAAGTHCDLQVRATDAGGIDSNMSKVAFDFK
jgi:hypothetical protein